MTNSAISSGLGQGIRIINSQGVTLDGNVIHDMRFLGIYAQKSANILINNNVVSYVQQDFPSSPGYLVWKGLFGGIDLSDDSNSDFLITNNIVAAVWHRGFSLPAYACGGTNVHANNLAHSISGYGVIV